ncbi:MAG: aconitase family protein, partial [Planctomycetota bacterium]
MANSFGSKGTLNGSTIYRLSAVSKKFPQIEKLPFSLKILLENLLRTEDDINVTAADITALAKWDPKAEPTKEIAFTPARVLLQDFTGVPAIVDLAAMRDAMKAMGGDPKKINPLQPAELVIDHSVQVDSFGTAAAFQQNTDLEYERNQERYTFLRWGQSAFKNFKAVPPETGIVHQVNIEYLARVIFHNEETNELYPDTLVGTDSHTTMVNGLGVLGWGVGGIEAEAAMLGQPVSMLIPQVIGFKLSGQLPEGATATDLVLTVTQMLRKKGVVGKFVEFFGTGLDGLPLADRATIANMAPEYGATCGIFPIDDETIAYLRLTGRSEDHIRRVEDYAKEQGLWRTNETPDPIYTDTLGLDLATVVPSLAGPSRPQDRVDLKNVKKSFHDALPSLMKKDT